MGRLLTDDVHETFLLSSRDGSAYFLTFKLIQRNFRARQEGGEKKENVYHSAATITYFSLLVCLISLRFRLCNSMNTESFLSYLALEFSLCENWLRIEPIERKEQCTSPHLICSRKDYNVIVHTLG